MRVLSYLARPDEPAGFTVLDVQPSTGRKHQIRIHLASVGHPLVGDKIYGDDETRYLRFVVGALTEDDRRALVLENHALHAVSMACQWRGQDWQWRAPIPERLYALGPFGSSVGNL